MAILTEVFEKIAAAEALDSEERVLWLNFLNSVIATKDKVAPMAPGQSMVTALSQITNNAGRLTNGEYISPADQNAPYPEDDNFTGVVQDSDGIRGINAGILQFQLDSADGKAYAGRGAVEIDENGISFPQSGSDGITWGGYVPEIDKECAAIYRAFRGIKIASWKYLSANLLGKVDFSDGFTGWTLSHANSFEITTLPDVSGNICHCIDSLSNQFVYQARASVTAGETLLVSVIMKKPTTGTYVNILYYDAITGGTLIGSSIAVGNPSVSTDFAISHGFSEVPVGATYAEIKVGMEIDSYLLKLYVSKVNGASLEHAAGTTPSTEVFGDLVTRDRILSNGVLLTNDGIIFRPSYGSGPTPPSDSSQISLYSETDGDIFTLTYLGTAKRLLTTDDYSGIDSGATLPTSPQANELFMHTPTGRRVLLVYTNSAWYPLYSFGTMTLYVDGTSGTDAADKGTGTGASAYKTLSYMWTQLPSTFYGNITVNVAAGTYAETLTAQGKMAGGAFTISIVGAGGTAAVSSTMTSAVQGTGATAGSITDTSLSMTTDAYRGYFIKYGSTIRVIKSNTADTFSIAGTFPGTPSGAYTVFEPGTIIDGGATRGNCVILNAQTIVLSMLKITNSTGAHSFFRNGSNFTLTNCSLYGTSGKNPLFVIEKTIGLIQYCSVAVDGNSFGVRMQDSTVQHYGSVIYQRTGTKIGTGVWAQFMSNAGFEIGNAIDNFNVNVFSATNSVAQFNSAVSNGYNFIINGNIGLAANTGGQGNSTSNNQYAGNTTDESATAASFGYID